MALSDPPATFELEEFDEWLATFPSLEAIPDKDGCTLQDIRNRSSPVAAVHRPLPPSGKRKRTTASNYQQEADARKIHILSERERRRSMNGLFSKLASLLPESSVKSDKCVIVEETISYIQALENELKELSKKREEVMKNTVININTGSVSPLKKLDITMKLGNSGSARDGNHSLGSSQAPNVVLSICKRHVFVTMCSSKSIANVLSTAIAITEQHKLIILDANMSTNESMAFLYLHLEAGDENMLVYKDALQTQLPDLTNICLHQAP